jgi:hypothetical protein
MAFDLAAQLSLVAPLFGNVASPYADAMRKGSAGNEGEKRVA